MPQQRKKVLFLITKSTLGGAQRYVEDLATKLPKEAYETAVAVGGDGPLVNTLKAAGIKVYLLTHLKRDVSYIGEVRSFFELVRIIRQTHPDILHINSSKAGLLGSIAGRLCGVPNIIFTAHGWAFNEDRPSWQKHILMLLHGLTILFSHTTITVSNGMRAQMRMPFTKKKMVTIPHGRSVVEMKSKEDARGILEAHVHHADARLIDNHHDFWIGTIAELHPIKCLDRAIDAMSVLTKSLHTLRLVIVHDGELRTQLEERVRSLELTQHVFFTGTIENAAQLLPAFDLFVLPSKSESFGYVLLEAGQAHLPVVATRVGGVPDIIEDGKNGVLVPPENTPALTEALLRLITDTELRERLAAAHYKKVQSFTLEKMFAQTQKIYLR